MLRKCLGVAVIIIMAVFIVGGIIYRRPHNIIAANVENISKIEVSEVTVTDRETIKKILDDLNGSKYKRILLSAIGGHEEYSVRGYNESGKLIFSIGIANEQTVDTGFFWEECTDGKLNLSLYQGIVDEAD